MDPIVVADRNSRTALVVGQGPAAVRLVEMRPGELVVSRLTEDEFVKRGYRAIDYPVRAAVTRFLAHAGGVSPAARQALEGCLVFAAPLS